MQFFENVPTLPVAVAGLVLLLSAVYYYLKNRNLLPGPTGLPYFGLFPFLKDDTGHLQLMEYGKKYGDMYSFTYLGNHIVNLGSVKALKEVHVNKAEHFHRPTAFNMLAHILEDGVAMSNGESWKLQRKFFIQSFKTYGLSAIKENTIGPVYNSISKTMKNLNERKGVPFNVIELLTDTCTETMRKGLFGDGIKDEIIYKMNKSYAVSLEAMIGMNLLLIGPFGKLLFNTVPKLRRSLAEHKVLSRLIMRAIKNVESNLVDDDPTCVVEDWYMEKKKRRERGDSSWQYLTDKALVSSLAQMIGDGILSVAYFIGCFLYALVEYPQEQEKIYKEIIEVIGTSRLPEPDDKKNLPYTTAFMNEVIRTTTFFPIFPSLECNKECTVRGYRIPKGSITLLNIYQTHNDPSIYKNPHKFDPTRFMASEGKAKIEMPVEFGIGRRACAGEPYVMLQAFLFLTSIVKNYVISDPSPSKKSSLFFMTGVMELSLKPRN